MRSAASKVMEAWGSIRAAPSTTLPAGLFMPMDEKGAHPRGARLVDGDDQGGCSDGQDFDESQ
jgi:hypothetical protein